MENTKKIVLFNFFIYSLAISSISLSLKIVDKTLSGLIPILSGRKRSWAHYTHYKMGYGCKFGLNFLCFAFICSSQLIHAFLESRHYYYLTFDLVVDKSRE